MKCIIIDQKYKSINSTPYKVTFRQFFGQDLLFDSFQLSERFFSLWFDFCWRTAWRTWD